MEPMGTEILAKACVSQFGVRKISTRREWEGLWADGVWADFLLVQRNCSNMRSDEIIS